MNAVTLFVLLWTGQTLSDVSGHIDTELRYVRIGQTAESRYSRRPLLDMRCAQGCRFIYFLVGPRPPPNLEFAPPPPLILLPPESLKASRYLSFIRVQHGL